MLARRFFPARSRSSCQANRSFFAQQTFVSRRNIVRYHTMAERSGAYLVALDQGTTSSRAICYDVNSGKALAVHQVPLELITPKPGWVEQNPHAILDTCNECLKGVASKMLAQYNVTLTKENVRAIGITNQRETTVAWSKSTGKALHNALVWLDTRTSGLVKKYVDAYNGNEQHFAPRTGLPISTYFSALKIRWVIDNVPAVAQAAQEGDLAVGTVDSWLIWNLTGHRSHHVTDVTNASRTNLLNIHTLQWDEEILNALDIPRAALPEVRSSAEVYGTLDEGVVPELAGVPIAGCLGDQQSALVGQGCLQRGQAKNTYGTGCFMLYNTGSAAVQSSHRLLTTVAYKLGPTAPVSYALEGSVAIAGAGIEWLKNNLGIIDDPREIDALAGSVSSTGGLYIVPAFSGLFAPYWRPDARGVAIGLTSYTTKAHFARAMLEATAYQSTEILEAMEKDCGAPVLSLSVDGGLSRSSLLMQVQADLLGRTVERPEDTETTARGAAFAAGVAVGLWGPDNLHFVNASGEKRQFLPNINAQTRARRMATWRKAVERAFDWVIEDEGEGSSQK